MLPCLGEEVRVEMGGREVHFIFVAHTRRQAEKFAEGLIEQCEIGTVYISIIDKLTGNSGKGN